MPALDKSEYTLKSIYKAYKEGCVGESQLSYKQYSSILNEFNKALVQEILYDSAEVKLPCNLGTLRIRKRKIDLSKANKLRPNWEETKKLWDSNPEAKENKKLVYHLNEHRDGYKYKIYWDKKGSKVRNKSYYFFKPSRDFSRELAYILKNDFDIDYYM